MKRIRIIHETAYHYHQPVSFGPHRAMMRPREGMTSAGMVLIRPNKLAGNEHISVAVAREQEKVSPLAGTWAGPSNAFNYMEVSVQSPRYEGGSHVPTHQRSKRASAM